MPHAPHPFREQRSSLVRRSNALRLSAISLADNMRSGSFRSLYRGQGIEFSGVRDYFQGDDIRSIDWNVTARMGKPYVKMFDEERELVVFLIVDCSASMDASIAAHSRLYTAFETAALAALAAEHSGSPVGAVLFDGAIRFSIPPALGRNQVMLLLSRFDRMENQTEKTNGSALSGALSGAAKQLRKRTLVFVLSDFRAVGWETPLGILAAKHDVVAALISDPSDDALPKLGGVRFVDPETGVREFLPTSHPEFSRAWQGENAARQERWSETCKKHGAFPLILSTQEDPLHSLIRFFAVREGT